MLIRWLPLIVGVVPFVGLHVCYGIAIQHDYVPACNPYLDGCTSIGITLAQVLVALSLWRAPAAMFGR